MAFWKKSEDPWDRKPEKKRTVPAEGQRAVPSWVQEKKPPQPMSCPWCGGEMLSGNLYSGGQRGYGPLEWREGAHKSFLERIGNAGQERYVQLGCYEEAWYCEDCRKLVLDVGLALQQQGPNYEWKDGKVVFSQQNEESENDL